MPYKDILFTVNTGDLKAAGLSVDSDHKWGYELRLINNKQYCGKLLVLTDKKQQSSPHYHPVKNKKTFFVLSGRVNIVVLGSRGHNGYCYGVGECVTLIPGMEHRFSLSPCCEEALILEVSTQHYPCYNYSECSYK